MFLLFKLLLWLAGSLLLYWMIREGEREDDTWTVGKRRVAFVVSAFSWILIAIGLILLLVLVIRKWGENDKPAKW